eukprot:3690193-Amphidinium_carterae.1
MAGRHVVQSWVFCCGSCGGGDKLEASCVLYIVGGTPPWRSAAGCRTRSGRSMKAPMSSWLLEMPVECVVTLRPLCEGRWSDVLLDDDGDTDAILEVNAKDCRGEVVVVEYAR